MVSLSNNTQGNVNITTRNGAGVNLTSNNDTDVNANMNGNAQRAKSWAVGEGLIDGVDYSAKYYAGKAKESEEIASHAVEDIDTAKEQALSAIDTEKTEAIADMETAKEEKIGEIEDTAADFEDDLEALTTRAETARDEAEQAKEDIEAELGNYVSTSSLTTILSDYVLSSDLSTTLADYVTSAKLTTILDDYATKQWVNNQEYITSADLPTNYVTTDTAQDISGRKTFLGEKAIYFKQSATTNKLGFTLYNPSSTELGAFEWRPSTVSSGALLNINVPYSSSNYVGFRYWGTAVNVIAPKVATAGNYYIPTHITNGSTTVTATNAGVVNISTLLPDVSNFVTNSSLATTLSSYATQQWVSQQGYITGITSSDVTTALGYTPYNSTNPNGYQANVIETIKVNNTAQTVTSKAVNITVPTNTNQLTNGAGFITSSALSPYALISNLATVATSGSYNDLEDKPYIPSGVVVDQTYDGTSTNAQSGVAIAGAGFLKSISSSDVMLALGYKPANIDYLGDLSERYGFSSRGRDFSYVNSGTEKVIFKANTLTINDNVISSNIARTSQIPTVPTNISAFTNDSGYITGITSSNVTTALGYTPSDNTLSNVSSIDSSSAVQTALDGKADADLSNLSATGKTVIDGAFVASVSNIIENGTINANTTTSAYSLSSYLPNDSHTYEVFGDITGQTSSTSGQYVTFFVGMSGESAVRAASALTRTNNTMVAAGYFSGFVNTTRTINVTNSGTSKATGVTLRLLGYRRVGTNA